MPSPCSGATSDSAPLDTPPTDSGASPKFTLRETCAPATRSAPALNRSYVVPFVHWDSIRAACPQITKTKLHKSCSCLVTTRFNVEQVECRPNTHGHLRRLVESCCCVALYPLKCWRRVVCLIRTWLNHFVVASGAPISTSANASKEVGRRLKQQTTWLRTFSNTTTRLRMKTDFKTCILVTCLHHFWR